MRQGLVRAGVFKPKQSLACDELVEDGVPMHSHGDIGLLLLHHRSITDGQGTTARVAQTQSRGCQLQSASPSVSVLQS